VLTIILASGGNPLWMPLQSQMNSFVGYLLSIGLFMGLFYSNTWNARKFPFLSPLMFTNESTPKQYMVYNQTAILDKNYKVQDDLLEAQGLPFFTSSHIFGQIIRNLGITGTLPATVAASVTNSP
jgi:hypothetical protein